MRYLIAILLPLLLAGCTIPPALTAAPPTPEPQIAMTVNGREVPVWLCRFWLEEALRQTEPGQAPNPEQVRSRAIADAALCAVVDMWAEKQALPPDSEAPGEEAACLETLISRGLTESQARSLAQTGQRYRRLHQAALLPDSALAPSPQALEAFAADAGIFCVAQLHAEGEDACHQIERLFSQLNASADPQSLFFTLGAAAPQTFLRGDGALPAALENAAACLRPGQYSGILEAGEGFSILLRLPPEPALVIPLWLDSQLLNTVKSSEIQDFPALYEELFQNWQ